MPAYNGCIRIWKVCQPELAAIPFTVGANWQKLISKAWKKNFSKPSRS